MYDDSKYKPVYSIGEASKILGVVVPLLRMLEKSNLLLTARNEPGKRLYSQCALDYIKSLLELGRKNHFTLEDIQRDLNNLKCWEVLACPADKRLNCPHYINPNTFCWSDKSRLCQEETDNCRTCQVYRSLTEFLLPQE